MKIVKPWESTGVLTTNDKWLYTFYSYDGSGNLMAVYNREYYSSTNITYNQTDAVIYGSKRIGTDNEKCIKYYALSTDGSIVSNSMSYMRTLSYPGKKSYEISDHLGNVRSVVSGIKMGLDTTAVPDGIADVYMPNVLQQTDYYPFGAIVKGNSFRNSLDYRFGYNGKPDDNEWNGDGAMYDYGFRIYDPRICKFLSVDPLSPSYPELTPYQFASNTPIQAIDLDGLEAHCIVDRDGAYSIVDPSPVIEIVGAKSGYAWASTAISNYKSNYLSRLPYQSGHKYDYCFSKEEIDKATSIQLQIVTIWLTGGRSMYYFGATTAFKTAATASLFRAGGDIFVQTAANAYASEETGLISRVRQGFTRVNWIETGMVALNMKLPVIATTSGTFNLNLESGFNVTENIGDFAWQSSVGYFSGRLIGYGENYLSNKLKISNRSTFYSIQFKALIHTVESPFEFYENNKPNIDWRNVSYRLNHLEGGGHHQY